jgi:hypothetical protein
MTRLENAVVLVKEMFPELPDNSALTLADIIEKTLKDSEMKFCKDCKHMTIQARGQIECNRPMGLSPVTGEPAFRKTLAELERTLDATGCGTTARYFTIKSI